MKLTAHIIHDALRGERVGINLKGAFPENSIENATNIIYVYLELLDGHDQDSHSEIVTTIVTIPIVEEEEIGHVEEIESKLVFNIGSEALAKIKNDGAVLRVHMHTNIEIGLPLLFAFDPSPMNENVGVICAAIVLLSLYGLIIWEVVHRTFAAMIASTLAISVLAIMHQKPPMVEIIGWIDVETLLLLFGMMILVAILSETGIFDFLAVFAYKVKK